MTSGSNHMGSASIGLPTEIAVALELDQEIQLLCPCGLCEKEMKIWLGVPNDLSSTRELIARVKERYHLTADIRLFFMDSYMSPGTPIPVPLMQPTVAFGILKAVPDPDGMSSEGHNVLVINQDPQPPLDDMVVEVVTISSSSDNGNITSSESSPVAGPSKRMGKRAAPLESCSSSSSFSTSSSDSKNITPTGARPESSPVAGPARRIPKRAAMPYSSSSSSSSPDDGLKRPKKKCRGGAEATTRTSNNAQQSVRRKRKGIRSSGSVRVGNPCLYVESSPESRGSNQDPNWFPSGSTTSSSSF